jgi:hypothetical protein
MAKSSIVDVWFYVSPESGSIDQVVCWFPLGMSIREEGDWEISSKEEAGTEEKSSTHEVYQLNWESDALVIDESYDSTDPENDHIAVKMYDKGELTLEELKKYAEKILDPIQDDPEYSDLELED